MFLLYPPRRLACETRRPTAVPDRRAGSDDPKAPRAWCPRPGWLGFMSIIFIFSIESYRERPAERSAHPLRSPSPAVAWRLLSSNSSTRRPPTATTVDCERAECRPVDGILTRRTEVQVSLRRASLCACIVFSAVSGFCTLFRLEVGSLTCSRKKKSNPYSDRVDAACGRYIYCKSSAGEVVTEHVWSDVVSISCR